MTPHQFMREYEAAGGSGDLDRMLRLIDDDAVYWFSDGTSHVGKRAVEAAIRRNFEAIEEETYRISEVVWVAQSADFAACVYRFEWSGIVRGQPASGRGRGTSVLARRGDSWVVVHEHLSKGEPAASRGAE
ncbi:MAG TPA: nuclear transport factor 2 family protein [Tepidisphaeraceae bacterium]|jgi:ketosteroid isomerase-like protein